MSEHETASDVAHMDRPTKATKNCKNAATNESFKWKVMKKVANKISIEKRDVLQVSRYWKDPNVDSH